MKISFSTLGCPNWDLDTICQKGHAYGFDGVDFRGYLDTLDITKLPLPIDFELTHETMTEASKAVPCDSRESEVALGVTLRPVTETLVDTYRWIESVGGLTRDEIGAMADHSA